MPIYNFSCKKCNEVYEELVAYDETGKYSGIQCPKCESKRKVKLVNACTCNFTNPVGTDRWNSESQGHDYRFKHKIPSVQAERDNAMKKSHMGDQPYTHIDDISSGKNFGDVK